MSKAMSGLRKSALKITKDLYLYDWQCECDDHAEVADRAARALMRLFNFKVIGSYEEGYKVVGK